MARATAQAAVDTNLSHSKTLADLTDRRVWMLDVDDTMYPIDSGLHDRIKARICANANRTTAIRSQALPWIGADRDFKPEDLGVIFPNILGSFLQANPAGLEGYLNKVYGNDYTLIQPSPRLVQAFQSAQDKEVRVVFYTNGPSSPDPGKDYHTQKVLKRLGLSDTFNQYARQNVYDLIQSVQAGYGKPSEQGMDNALNTLRIDPAGALFFDDGVKNLKTAAARGMKTVWAWTSAKQPAPADEQLAQQIGAVRIYDIAEAVETLAALIP